MERWEVYAGIKREAVTITERGMSIAQASRDLSVHGSVLRRWVQEHAADPQQAPSATP